jgi:hypothetical protein
MKSVRNARVPVNPDFAVGFVTRRRKPIAKRVVGAVLRRRHNHDYVEEQNRVANDYMCNVEFCFIQRMK